jgi:RimJ/RimL family protein N-acetyltransferase
MNREIISIVATIIVAPIALTCGLLYWWNVRRRKSVRPATSQDVWFVRSTYNRNRDYFGGTDYVSKSEHQLWFDKLLADPDSLLLIGMVGSTRAGYIRVEKDAMSYCVVKRYRGRGLGSMMLRHVLFLRPKVSAKVMPGNIASRRLLEKYGFVRNDDAWNKKYVQYKREYIS